MPNIYGIVPLRGLRVEKNAYLLLNEIVDGNHVMIGLSYLSTLPPFEDVDLKSLMLGPALMQTIGYSGIEVFRKCPLLIFQLPENAFGDLKLQDSCLKIKSYINSISAAFSMACWLLKPSSVFFERILLEYNGSFISCRVDFKSHDFQCYCSHTDFCASEIGELKYYTPLLRTYAIYDYFGDSQGGTVQFHRLRKLMGEDYQRYEQNIPFRLLIPGKGPSFFKALVYLQKYLESNQISDRFRYGCSILEDLLATDDKGIKVKLAKRIATVIAPDKNEGREIFSKMKQIYTLRSGENHGDGMTFDTSTIDLSKSLDDYLRRLFNYILFRPSLNYGSFDGKEAKITKKQVDHFFQTMVKNCGWFES